MNKDTQFSLLLVVSLALFLAALLLTSYVHAERAPQLTRTQRTLVLYTARVSGHEGALVNLREVDLVWQAATFYGSTAEKRIAFLQRHSGRAIGVKPCLDTDINCWSAEMDLRGTTPPSVLAKGKEASDYWRLVVTPRWLEVVARARELVLGAGYGATGAPCAIQPRTWAARWFAHSAAKNGLYPIGCVGVLNDGFAPLSAFAATR